MIAERLQFSRSAFLLKNASFFVLQKFICQQNERGDMDCSKVSEKVSSRTIRIEEGNDIIRQTHQNNHHARVLLKITDLANSNYMPDVENKSYRAFFNFDCFVCSVILANGNYTQIKEFSSEAFYIRHERAFYRQRVRPRNAIKRTTGHGRVERGRTREG
jgi:hypothetical protein